MYLNRIDQLNSSNSIFELNNMDLGSRFFFTYITDSWLHGMEFFINRFRVNPHSIVAWMSRNSLLEAGAKFEG